MIIRTGPVYLVVWVYCSCLDLGDDIIETKNIDYDYGGV